MLNFLVNYAKVCAVWACDFVNRLYDPFEHNLTPTVVDSLPELDRKFSAELDAEFTMPNGEFLYEHPRPNDAGDTALWQGICTGMKILRGEDPVHQLSFLTQLFVHGALIRGYRNDGTVNDTTSNDSATGPLFAFYAALRFGDPYTREVCGALLVNWVANIKAHNWALVDQTGQSTKFGKLEDGYLTDPLRITLLLALLALASVYEPEFHADYVKLYNKYRPILAYPKVKLLWLDTSYDTHRAAISLHILYWLMKDDIYKRGLQRIWRISSKTNNAWVNVLCWEALGKRDENFVASVLRTFDYEKRQMGNLESLNSNEPSVNWPPKLPFGLGDAKKRSKRALPFNKRGSQDFFWQRHPFSLTEWEGVTHPYVFHSGLDFLVCYNLARRLLPG